ncbi:H2.0-like homeobox protein [Phlebotomus argentipes]|uniref:H2.0-like homeobox protein n=1 Tax=Phlebotomus argentipes TaxID=94469 RepID=UPI002892C83E|nr:H2.0-like homeobox protein [Phlebotomus argentipes]
MDYSVARTSCNSDSMIVTSESANPAKNALNFSVDRLLSCDRDFSDNSKCHPDDVSSLDDAGNRVIRPMPIRITGAGRDHRGMPCGDSSPVIPSIMRFTHLFTPTYNHHRSFYGLPPPQNPPLRSTVTAMDTPDASTSASPAASSSTKRKRSWSRAVFSNLQRKGLEIAFGGQKYITKPDRRKLAARLGLTDAQVKVWFQNRRMKWRHTGEEKNCPSKRSTFDKDEAFVGAEDDEIDVVSD